MKNSNRLIMQAVREAGSVLESIWQSWKESGPCCGIRFSGAAERPASSRAIELPKSPHNAQLMGHRFAGVHFPAPGRHAGRIALGQLSC